MLNVSSLNGNNGFAIKGTSSNDNLGWSVSSTGDVNGDGINDVIIGAPEQGKTYLIFGNAAAKLDLNGSAPGIDFVTTYVIKGKPLPIVDSANLSLINTDATSLQEAKVYISHPYSSEKLAADTSGTFLTVNYDSVTGTLTLSGFGSVSNYQKVLRSVTYSTTNARHNITRKIKFVVSDNGLFNTDSAVAKTTLKISKRQRNYFGFRIM